MRVATFNIQHGLPALGGPADAAAVAAACADLGADVLALQEVDRGVRRSGRADIAGTVAAATGMSLAWGRALRTQGGEYGNALLVRGTVAAVETLRLPRARRRGEPRTAIVARVRPAGGELDSTVAATHLGLSKGESLAQLRFVLAALTARPGPWVLLGDLNRYPHEVEAEVEAFGLRAVPTGPTFPAHDPRHRIDFVAVGGLAVRGAAVHRTPVGDHCAVVVDVTA